MKYLNSLFLLLVLSGCATTNNVPSILKPIFWDPLPAVQISVDPGFKQNTYSTFSIYQASDILTDYPINSIDEKKILFFLRSALERKGYRFVEMEDTPDIIFTAIAKSDQKKTYYPPSTATRLKYVPGTTSTTNTNSSGNFDGTISGGQGSSAVSGSYYGTSTSSTVTPGGLAAESYTKPGYTVRLHYPSVALYAYDGNEVELVWAGTGENITNTSDIRISSQRVINKILEKLPYCTATQEDETQPYGLIGIDYQIYTVDGNNFLPIIQRIVVGSPAEKVGIKKYDVILEVDGFSCLNLSDKEVKKRITGKVGQQSELKLWRNGKIINSSVKRISRQTILP